MDSERCLFALNRVFAVRREMQRANEIASLLTSNWHLPACERFSRSGINLDEWTIFQKRFDACEFVWLYGFKISVQAKTADRSNGRLV